MKNHWLNLNSLQELVKQDDEYSIVQGGGNGNLDIYYMHDFIQNEVLKCTIHGKCANLTGFSGFSRENPMCITGIIYHKGVAVQKICSTETNNSQFTLEKLPDAQDVFAYNIGYLSKAECIVVDWNTEVDHNDVWIVVDYEADRT